MDVLTRKALLSAERERAWDHNGRRGGGVKVRIQMYGKCCRRQDCGNRRETQGELRERSLSWSRHRATTGAAHRGAPASQMRNTQSFGPYCLTGASALMKPGTSSLAWIRGPDAMRPRVAAGWGAGYGVPRGSNFSHIRPRDPGPKSQPKSALNSSVSPGVRSKFGLRRRSRRGAVWQRFVEDGSCRWGRMHQADADDVDAGKDWQNTADPAKSSVFCIYQCRLCPIPAWIVTKE